MLRSSKSRGTIRGTTREEPSHLPLLLQRIQLQLICPHNVHILFYFLFRCVYLQPLLLDCVSMAAVDSSSQQGAQLLSAGN